MVHNEQKKSKDNSFAPALSTEAMMKPLDMQNPKILGTSIFF
jgi:hypothetical protein